MPLDAENKAIVDFMIANAPPVGSKTAAELRALMKQGMVNAPRGPEVGSVEDHLVAGKGGQIPVRVYLPETPAVALVMYVHGGGYTLGSLDMWDFSLRALCKGASCAIVSVDYRLAPEHPFPAAVDDTWSVLHWLGDNVVAVAGSNVPLIVAGDSAGANLVAVASVLARDAGGPLIAAQILLYPSIMGDIDHEFLREFEPPRLKIPDIDWYWTQYIDPKDRNDPRFAVGLVEDLSGLPPAFILTAENDILRQDGEFYGLKLVQAGVPVQMRRYLGTVHGFFNMTTVSQWRACQVDIATYIRSLAGASGTIMHPDEAPAGEAERPSL